MSNQNVEALQMEIQMLKIQIQQQKIREETMNNLNDALTQQLAQFSNIVEQRNRLIVDNELLSTNIKQMKQRHEKQVFYYDEEICKLKQELHEKITQIERFRIDSDKKALKLQEKINMMQNMVEKKCTRIAELQKTIHQQQISSYKQSGKSSRLTYMPTSNSHELASSTIRNNFSTPYHNNDSFSNTENNMMISNIPIQNSIRTQSKRESARSKNSFSKNSTYNKELISLSKDEMKVMMKSLIRSKKQIQKGSNQLSMLSEISTLPVNNNSKRNKTVLH